MLKPHIIQCLLFIMFQNIKDSTGMVVHSTHGGVLDLGILIDWLIIFFFGVISCYFFYWKLLWTSELNELVSKTPSRATYVLNLKTILIIIFICIFY